MRGAAHFADAVTKWEAAALTESASTAIHPTGVDDDAYDASGLAAADEFAEIFPPDDATVLDFGCGDGRVAQHLAGRYYRVIGADASPTMLARLNARTPTVEPFLWDGIDRFDEIARDYGGMIDAVFSVNVLLHHEYLDGAQILANLAALVGRDGTLAVQVPIYDVPLAPEGWTSVGVWTLEMFEAAAEHADCDIEMVYPSEGAFTRAAIGTNHPRLHHLTRR